MHSTPYLHVCCIRGPCAAMAMKPKLMLFSHVCNTRSITGAEKLLLHFMREIGTIFACVLVAPQEGNSPDSHEGLAFRFIYVICRCFTVCTHRIRDCTRCGASAAHPAFQDALWLIRSHEPDMVLTNTCVNVMPAVAAKSLGIPVI